MKSQFLKSCVIGLLLGWLTCLPAAAAVNVRLDQIEWGSGTDTTMVRTGAGAITIEGSAILKASDIGASVQAFDSDLSTWAGVTPGTGVAAALAVNVGSAGAPVLFNGAGGTPSIITLTNGVGLPVSGITSSTSTALGVGSLELSHASANTLTGSSGILSVEGVAVPTISSTHALSNKRIVPRVTTITSSATPTVNTDNCDCVTITALATAITSMTTNLSGTPNDFDRVLWRFKDDGTARAIVWGASFESSGSTLPSTTVAGKVLTVGTLYNSVKGKHCCVAVDQEP